MASTTDTRGSRDQLGDPTWAAYFDTLAAVVDEVEDALASGRPPVLPTLTPPGGPPPREALARRDTLLGELGRVADRLVERRDAVRSELSLLAPPRPQAQAVREAGLGARLDLVG